MEIKDIINNRQDVIPSIYSSLGRLVFDLAVSLVANDTDKWEKPQMDTFMSLWKQELKPVSPFNQCICGYIVQLLEDSKDTLSWKTYSQILVELIKENLLTCQVLQKSFLDLVRSNQEYLENLTYCFHCISEELDTFNLSEVMEWILTLSCNDTVQDNVRDIRTRKSVDEVL